MTRSRGAYSRTWYDVFARTVPAETTAREVLFLVRLLPNPPYSRVLDVACGTGRHAIPLAAKGYAVTGLDANEEIVASLAGRGPTFVVGDMRAPERSAPGPFDAVLCLWQSFGWFDDAENESVLARFAALLEPRGRIVLDVYNRAFFETRLGPRPFERGGVRGVETKTLAGGGKRLAVRLEYEGRAETDAFEWRVYTEDELAALARGLGLSRLLASGDFDPRIPPSSDRPRMQLVFEKGAAG